MGTQPIKPHQAQLFACFHTGKVIKGWDEGVRTMRKGELAVLTCRAGRRTQCDRVHLQSQLLHGT